MITIWHNSNFMSIWIARLFEKSFPDSISLEDLTPVAIIECDELDLAWAFSQNELNKDERVTILNSSRSTSVGDILQKSDNSCWFVDCSGFEPFSQPLPHVEISKDSSSADNLEVFPTLDLPDWAKADLIETTVLSDGWHYLETRQWQDGAIRQLLRCYK